MKVSHRRVIAACAVAVVAALLIWHFCSRKAGVTKDATSTQSAVRNQAVSAPAPDASTSPHSPITTPSEAEIEQRTERKWSSLFSTPIEIYGKVVDEIGGPIAGANVEIHINDNPAPNKSGTTYTKMTDEGGLFSLTGMHGIGFGLRASKGGYYTTKESTGSRNVTVPGKEDSPQPTKEQPIVLVLHKQGQAVPLIATKSGQIDVPKTGQPVIISLMSGRIGNGELHVASWVSDSNQHRFDWRYQLSVPGGGLIERTGQFDFEAPADGYQASAEFNMPATAQQWSVDGQKQYFVKLPDGRYARFLIRFYARQQRNFVVLESYINPTPGSRNLEFDPTRVIKPGS